MKNTLESSTLRFQIRGASRRDEEPLLELSRHLNTVNLPHDRTSVRELLTHAEKSFGGEIPAEHRKYVFLLWDHEQERAIGTSSLIGRLGRRDAPYIFVDVLDEERYSSSLDRHFHHTLLRLGFSYNGPTELGGLVLSPEFRGFPQKLGRFVSFCRFPFIAARRSDFQDQMLAELLPPLEPDGTSHLWEAFGRRFTSMSYGEADLLSSRDKEFIRDLFPRGIVHASLFSEQAQAVIGKVGAQTLGVERMLRSIGFRYARRVDPFDGGPHFVAPTDEVTLVQNTRRFEHTESEEVASTTQPVIALRLCKEAPYVRVVQSTGSLLERTCQLAPEAAAALELRPGDEYWVVGLPNEQRRADRTQAERR